MAIGDQDHDRIAIAVAAMLAGTVHQPLDLALGEIVSLDCQVYDAWCVFLGCRFHADKPCLRVSYCICHTHFLHSQTSRGGCASWPAARPTRSACGTLPRQRRRIEC